MPLLHDTGNGLQRGKERITRGFYKNHIYKPYEDNLRNKLVDIFKLSLFIKVLNMELTTVEPLYFTVDEI
ncbi:hypothetical protein FACS1894158_17330 [Betaproteobacteria bacterium]|nr:hypothetical protein FACS1894158_17330 [Betaproteobacteria bacterium]